VEHILPVPSPPPFTRILVISDIEGSSGCDSHRAAPFLNDEWAAACLEMSRDVDAVVRALFSAGARQVTVKDFHRAGFNLRGRLGRAWVRPRLRAAGKLG
jgi:D-aminopeptidase